MDAVVGRLDKVLRREWFTHVQTLPTHHAHMPTFQDFAAWIQQKSHIARLDRSSRLDRDKYKSSPTTAHATPKIASLISTPPSLPQAAQTQKMRSPMPKARRGTPGGDREYRDSTRNSRSPPHASTFNTNRPEELHLAPNAPRSREASPKLKKFWCVWCTENGRTHQHSTANSNCSMLQNANASDQWKVINKHKVCDSCLVQGHYWKHCPNKIQERCKECGNSHHPNLLCLPLKQTSTYPGAG